MKKIKLWSCLCVAGFAGVALSTAAIAQQNGRLLPSPPVAPVQTTVVAPAAPTLAPTPPAPEPAVAVPVASAPAAAVPATTPAPAPVYSEPVLHKGVAVWWDITVVGETTRDLMAAQAAGDQATATPLPTLGATASQARDRYLESFSHPIPEWFKQNVDAME